MDAFVERAPSTHTSSAKRCRGCAHPNGSAWGSLKESVFVEQFSIRKASGADAEMAETVVRRSIRKLCLQDHNSSETLLHAWLANKTLDNFRSWTDASACSYLAAAAGVLLLRR